MDMKHSDLSLFKSSCLCTSLLETQLANVFGWLVVFSPTIFVDAFKTIVRSPHFKNPNTIIYVSMV